jgi:flagellar biosynthetic protein FliP
MRLMHYFFALLTALMLTATVPAIAQQTPSNQAPSTSAPNAQNMPQQAVDMLSGIPAVPAFTVKTHPDGSQDYSVTLQILFIMTALTLLPAFLLMMTSFTRIIIVFSILRQAIGLNQTPSNQIMLGMALFLTIFIMMPVFEKVNESALQPYLKEEITSMEAVKRGSVPFHEFMLAQTRESDIELFMKISKTAAVATPDEIPFFVLVPAYVASELKTAFQIGFTLFIPFLVIDMVVASVLMAMGMMMLSPIIISLPFKLMLFVLVDGWSMIIGTMAASFGV